MRPPKPIRIRRDRPLYKQVADDIRAQIADGELQPGELLPGEADLADHFGVGLNTVRSALAVLRAEGLVVTEKARGSSIRIPKEPLVVTLPPSGRAWIRPATDEEREVLDLPSGSLVVEITDGKGRRQVVPALGTIVEASGSDED